MERIHLLRMGVQLARESIDNSAYLTEQRCDQLQHLSEDKAIALIATELLIIAATNIITKSC